MREIEIKQEDGPGTEIGIYVYDDYSFVTAIHADEYKIEEKFCPETTLVSYTVVAYLKGSRIGCVVAHYGNAKIDDKIRKLTIEPHLYS